VSSLLVRNCTPVVVNRQSVFDEMNARDYLPCTTAESPFALVLERLLGTVAVVTII
jgi:hypothetical protein